MQVIEAESVVAAPPEEVWPVLVDLASYPEWDSGVVRTEGVVRAGEKITVVSAINPKRAFPVRVDELTPPHRMVWVGGMPWGLFRGRRTFELVAVDAGTRFRIREEFSGPLEPLIRRSMPDLRPSLQQFATGLAQRVEDRHGSRG